MESQVTITHKFIALVCCCFGIVCCPLYFNLYLYVKWNICLVSVDHTIITNSSILSSSDMISYLKLSNCKYIILMCNAGHMLVLLFLYIMKRKLKQWWANIQSTQWTITLHNKPLNKRPRIMALEILVLALDRHKNVVICRCICFYVQGVGRETIACFVDNSGIGDHHCLNFLF